MEKFWKTGKCQSWKIMEFEKKLKSWVNSGVFKTNHEKKRKKNIIELCSGALIFKCDLQPAHFRKILRISFFGLAGNPDL